MNYTKRTLENLSGLNKKFRVLIETFLQRSDAIAKEFNITIEILSGYRSSAQQAALYAQGRTKPGKIVTKAKSGTSFHNYGIAVDLGLFCDGKYLDKTNPVRADRIYKQLAIIAESLGIEWAGNWKTFSETPHFQKTYGMTISQLREKLAQVGDIQKLI